ncbi:MAG TPA: thiamine phosphate synthase [Candidatus Goldiibacteriota bacterium]|nr:thiamine phosphate synthase [Candidatus Goldiibacteriota bacterium]
MGPFPTECGIYPVITEKFCLNGSSIRTLEQVLKAGIKIVQLREKEYPKDRILQMARAFREITSRYRAMLIINDHVDIALAVKADGVHVGQEDRRCAEIKRIAPRLVVGVSTHNIAEALKAKLDGADYINIGPVFETKTKETNYPPVGIDNMKKIAHAAGMPFSIMGGIKESNIRLVFEAGARIIAMITEITMAEDPCEKAVSLNKMIE